MYTLLFGYLLFVLALSTVVGTLWSLAYFRFQTPKYHTPSNWPTLTVFVPIYNEASIIVQFLQNLLNTLNGYKGQIQLILIDDGSTDDSVFLIQSNFPDLTLIVDGLNKGKLERIIQASKMATGEYFLVIDADVVLTAESLEILVATLFSNPKAATVQPYMIPITPSKIALFLGRVFTTGWEMWIRKAQGGMGTLSLWGCQCSLARTKVLKVAIKNATGKPMFKAGRDDSSLGAEGFATTNWLMVFQPLATATAQQAGSTKAFVQQTKRHRSGRIAKLQSLFALLFVKPYFAISMIALEILYLVTFRPIIEVLAFALRCKNEWRPVGSRWSSA